MPKISVIVPVYNVEKYLRQCLDSILNQTFKDFECICVNDGSTDNSLQILNEYANKDSRIKIISQENKGLAGARNTGVKNANTKYLTFIDSDDWVDDKYLELLYTEIERTKSDISCCNLKKYYQKENSYVSDSTPQERKFNITDLDSVKIRKGYEQPCATVKIYKKSFMDSNNLCFFEGFINEDAPFSAFCFAFAKKVSYIDNELYFYRLQRENSITSGTSSKKLLFTHKVINFTTLIKELIIRNKFNNDIFNFTYKFLFWNLSGFCKKEYDNETRKYILDIVLDFLKTIYSKKEILNTKDLLKLKFLNFLLIHFKIKSFALIRILKNFVF
jgi:glycosyltransferase involved in cell wall biosynthesis